MIFIPVLVSGCSKNNDFIDSNDSDINGIYYDKVMVPVNHGNL